MLEFVYVDGANDGKDLNTRRKVRSQAMRDFRRRQRAEKEAVKDTRRSLSVPKERNNQTSAAGRDRAASSDSGLSDLSVRRSSRTIQKRTSATPVQKDGEAVFKVSQLRTVPDMTRDLASIDLVDDWQDLYHATNASALDQWLWTTSAFPSSEALPEIVATTESGMEEPLDNPTQVSDLLSFCRNCGNTPAGSWCRDGVCDCCAWLSFEAESLPHMAETTPPSFDWSP